MPRQLIVGLFICCLCQLYGQNKDSIAYEIDLKDYVITAQYEPTHYKRALHRVRILPKTVIEQTGASTLEDVVTLIPSIQTYKDPILGSSLRMRGIAANNIAILIDGVPVIGRNNGAIDISQIALNNVERIEIIEGPLSSIYGNNAAGGVINIIRSTSQRRSWKIKQSTLLDSKGQQDFSAHIGYQYKKIQLGIDGRYFAFQAYPEDSLRIVDKVKLDNQNFYLQSRYPFNPKKQYAIGSMLQFPIHKNNRLIWRQAWNIEVVRDYGNVKRPSYKPYAFDALYRTSRHDYSLQYKGNIYNIDIQSTSSFNQYNRYRDQHKVLLESKEIDSTRSSTDTIQFTQWFHNSIFSYTKAKNWKIRGGINLQKSQGIGDRINPKHHEKAQFIEHGLYSDVRYNGIKKLSLSLTNRFIYHSNYKHAYTWSIQGKYQLNEKVHWRASIAKGYRSPSLKELYLEFIDINHHIVGNPALEPEHSMDYQTTIDLDWNKHIHFSLNAYTTQIQNKIQYLEFEPYKFTYGNLDQYRVFGFQPACKLSWSGIQYNSSLAIGYWATNIQLEKAPKYGQQINWNNSLEYKYSTTDWTTTLHHRFYGPQARYRIQDKAITISKVTAYNIFDLSSSKSLLNKKIRATIGIKNLLNIQSAAINGTAGGGAHSGGRRNLIDSGRRYFLKVSFTIE